MSLETQLEAFAAAVGADMALRLKDVVLTQAEYDALPVKDPNTIYHIIEE